MKILWINKHYKIIDNGESIVLCEREGAFIKEFTSKQDAIEYTKGKWRNILTKCGIFGKWIITQLLKWK